jgi:hypothetical protein
MVHLASFEEDIHDDSGSANAVAQKMRLKSENEALKI